MDKKRHTTHTGFTLIEVMVAVSIFAIVVTVGIGAILSVNTAYSKSRSQRTALDNISFALETIAREIRVGTLHQQLPIRQ